MVAFSFKASFADDVASGRKPSTIRATKRCSVGDKVQLYTGLRTKHCRKLRDAVCIGTAEVCLDPVFLYSLSNVEGVVRPDPAKMLYEQEGFKSPADMLAFFREHYGLPFVGWLHVFGEEK